jgi:hypothetical protein
MKLIIKISTLFLLVAATATAQHDLTVYREFARVGQGYVHTPLQMKIHFVYKVTPVTTNQDGAETDMILHYDDHNFYMQAEDMEQIVNDSLIVMVNHEAKMIRIYNNNVPLLQKLQSSVTMFIPDSSLEKLSQRYSAMIGKEGTNKRVTLQSRDRVSGADAPKEVISVSYDGISYQPITYQQIKRSFIPVDSTKYTQLKSDSVYAKRLISTKTNAGNLFFVVKEKITECRFMHIGHEQKSPPAREHDRIIRTANGEYEPAKGYEGYTVSRE